MEEQPKQELRYLIRLVNTDLDGKKPVLFALRKIRGVGTMFANAVCKVTKIDPTKRLGYLSDEEIKKLETTILNPVDFPPWLFNRRKDFETGKDLHIAATELQIAKENDIKLLKKIKCYKGVRHMYGLPVRGQNTRSNFRKNKGKAKLGVTKASTVSKPAADKGKGGGKEKK